jgi:hypothetical protein
MLLAFALAGGAAAACTSMGSGSSSSGSSGAGPSPGGGASQGGGYDNGAAERARQGADSAAAGSLGDDGGGGGRGSSGDGASQNLTDSIGALGKAQIANAKDGAASESDALNPDASENAIRRGQGLPPLGTGTRARPDGSSESDNSLESFKNDWAVSEAMMNGGYITDEYKAYQELPWWQQQLQDPPPKYRPGAPKISPTDGYVPDPPAGPTGGWDRELDHSLNDAQPKYENPSTTPEYKAWQALPWWQRSPTPPPEYHNAPTNTQQNIGARG